MVDFRKRLDMSGALQGAFMNKRSFGPPPDSNPDAFSFTNSTGASISTLTTSNTITPTGYNVETTWSVGSGGQGSVAGGAYATSGTISPGQTLTVRATSSASYETATSHLVTIGAVTSTWSITTSAPAISYTTAGTFSFVVPTGVTSVNGVAIGGGGGGQGGGRSGMGPGGGGAQLSYTNNIAVTPGETLTVIVGAGGAGGAANNNSCYAIGGNAGNGENSSIRRGGTDLVMAKGGEGASGNNFGRGGGIFGDGVGFGRSAGGPGGRFYSGSEWAGGGGGAGGYSGQGGQGGSSTAYQTGVGKGEAPLSGGGGGAGGSAGGQTSSQSAGWFQSCQCGSQSLQYFNAGGGGGTGLGAIGANGTAASWNSSGPGTGGGGGSGGGTGGVNSGGLFGGGGGGGGYAETQYWDGQSITNTSRNASTGGAGGRGGVRITWNGKTFPSNSG